ncbi:Protein ARABIDILLO 2 [Hibiscus syriacus]|uniref:Protein ARABIDILLO 2 n=1 Tax=Hibiscus syriacus TaxID=106335 RepID=A0A6A2XAH3_HIBSY|nr:Protein ARABIDILLO 2 [Hibiscus syriacus]
MEFNLKLGTDRDGEEVDRGRYQRLREAPGSCLHNFKISEGDQSVEIYTDVDWAGSVNDKRSTSSYCSYVWCNLVTWRSNKQSVLARSSAEVEYRALSHGICEGIWIQLLMGELKVLYTRPIKMYCDNQAVVSITHNPLHHDHTKHVEIDRHFIKERINSGELYITYLPDSNCGKEGGINILAGLASSMNKLVAEEAAEGLWNLSVGEEHKAAIAEAGGVQALVDLIFKWSSGGDGVLERAAGALANLAADDKCSIEVASAGGVNALVMLARNCKFEGVQEQAARALANLASHGDSNSNNAAVGQEAGARKYNHVFKLALGNTYYIRFRVNGQEAAGALWNLSFDDRNREAIAAAGGVEALIYHNMFRRRVDVSQSSDASSIVLLASQQFFGRAHAKRTFVGLQERAAGAHWGLSVSEANSIAIGREGGVAPLIALARSDAEDVHETAAGALWNLAFNHSNALRIVEEGGVPALVHLCSPSLSKMALKHIEAFIRTFSNPQAFAAAAASSAQAALAQVTEKARIQEAGHLRCSGAEIGRFISMLRNSSPIRHAQHLLYSSSLFPVVDTPCTMLALCRVLEPCSSCGSNLTYRG